MRSSLHARLRRFTLFGVSIIVSGLFSVSCGKTGAPSASNAAGATAEGGSNAGSSTAMAGGGIAIVGGSRTSDAGSSTGGSGNNGGEGPDGGSESRAGSGAVAGASTGGTAGGAAGGEAGAGGLDPLLGVDCRNTHCGAGDVCVFCGSPVGADYRCAPHPVTAPEAYAMATASCDPAPYGYNECDGPEDCPSDRYCVAKDGVDGRQRCRSTTPSRPFCCFTCNASVDCTLCRNDSDCPEDEGCGIVFETLKGCTKK
jgi:hypothetical protein